MPVLQTATLPRIIKQALREIGYKGRTIRVSARGEFNPFNPGAEGTRGLLGLFCIATGSLTIERGSFGGPNPWTRGCSPIDYDKGAIPTVPGYLYLSGTEGGHGTSVSIVANPQTMAPLLPNESVSLSAQERSALRAVVTNMSSGRDWAFRLSGLGHYGAENPLVQSLVQKGLLSVSRSGSVSVTAQGKGLVYG